MNTPKHNPAVLLIDPNSELLRALTRELEDKDYDVVALPDPSSAIKYINDTHKRFDVVISDVFTPKITGADFLATYKKLFPDAPVILTTNTADWHDYKTLHEGGAFDCLCKPLSKSTVLSAIRHALNNTHSIPPTKSANKKTIHA